MSDAKLHLGTLGKLGVDPATLTALRQSIDKSTVDREKVDPYNYVPLGVLAEHARLLGKKELGDRLRKALAIDVQPPIVAPQPLDDYPKLTLGAGASNNVPGAKAGSSIDKASLAAWWPALEALLAALAKEQKLPPGLDPKAATFDAAALAHALHEHGPRLRRLPNVALTQPQIEQLYGAVASKLLPAHEEKDAQARFDAKLTRLFLGEGPAAGVQIHHKRQYEGFSIRRGKQGQDGQTGFVLQGFKSDRILVSLPKGCSLLLVDADGNERGAGLPKSEQTIDGQKQSTVEISRSLVEPSGKQRIWDPHFTIKVLNAAGEPVLSQNIQFGKVASWTSEPLLEGSFGYQKIGDGDAHAQWIANHGVPPGSKNPVPLGKRPAFQLGAGASDRLAIQCDAHTPFVVADLLQLLSPPARKPQAFSVKGKGEALLTYTLESDSHGVHDARIKSSNGHSVSFDPSLHQTTQARFGLGGVTLYSSEGVELGRFDPLDPKQNKRA